MSDLISSLAELQDTLNTAERRHRLQTVPSDEPLAWDRTRLVRLDVVIAAMHLVTVRIGVKSVPGLIRQRAETIINTLARNVGLRLGAYLFGAAFRQIFAPIRLIIDQWQGLNAQIEEEQLYRRRFLQTAREIHAFTLRQTRTRRRKKSVYTRHPSPLQRRANGRRTQGGNRSE